MFRRLLTEEEERPASFIDATAIEIRPADASKCFHRKNLPPVPAYLKRVKNAGTSCLFLVCLGIDRSIPQSQIVQVPEFPPCTPSQFTAASGAWPCHYWRGSQADTDFNLPAAIMDISTAGLLLQMRTFAGGAPGGGAARPAAAGHPGLACAGMCIICDEGEILCRAFDTEYIFGHAILEAVRDVSKSKRGYLCTGYTAYVYREPCTSCAMALVHARIKRVFCMRASTAPGSAFSGLRFNYNQFLNHRYPVYFYTGESLRDEATEP